jgi:hypothetical protein
MAFRWEPQGNGGAWAYSGEHVVGMVVTRFDGTVYWTITGVAGSKYQAATSGEVATLAQAKRSLRRAWLTWLSERGLTEAEPPRTRRRTV